LKEHDRHEHTGRKVPIKEGPGLVEKGAEEAMGSVPHAAAHDKAASGIDAELEKANKLAAEMQDRYLRLYAETENFKKRMVRESAEREKYYNEGIIKELLPVIDNLERALAHAGEGTPGNGLAEGVGMVRKQLMDVLTRSGVTKVESVGLPFDPSRQQAIMQVETDEYPEGTVVEELQKGYFLNERILRPAMVTVAKKPAQKTQEQSPENPEA